MYGIFTDIIICHKFDPNVRSTHGAFGNMFAAIVRKNMLPKCVSPEPESPELLKVLQILSGYSFVVMNAVVQEGGMGCA